VLGAYMDVERMYIYRYLFTIYTHNVECVYVGAKHRERNMYK
jgi:hypothetical protein